MLEKFPDHKLQSLKRRSREFREELSVSSDPADLYRVYQKRERIEVRGLKNGTRIMATSDYQIPHTDWATVAAVEAFMVDFRPDIKVYVGDVLDEEHLSVFTKNPTATFSLNDEFRIGRDMLSRHRKICGPDTDFYWEDGNHEDRLTRELWKTMPALYGLDNGDEEVLTIPHIMGFGKLGITHLNYRSVLDIEGFQFVHGWMTGQNIAKKMYQRLLTSGACGHTHTPEEYHTAGANGHHGFYVMGCLCDLAPDWTKDPYPGWTQGFLTAEVWNHKLHVQLHTIYSDGFAAYGRFYPRKETT